MGYCGGVAIPNEAAMYYSDFMRDVIFEKLEDAEDLATLREAMRNDDGTRYTHEEVLKELGL
ncbi:DUF6290 family protein [Trueperella pyogenes]|uniref:DUF6290 family protein n=1 Tax=Trueperella pyogenes TaxID=1661 RepID=UPI00321F83C1